jgi:tyrosyl-tRNA synthetase
MFGKLMSIPDELMVKYFRLATDLSPWQVDEIEEALDSGKLHPAEAKRRLAWEIVRMYHGEAAADEARQRFDRVFRDHRMPPAAEIPEQEIPSECVADGGIVWLPRLLHLLGLAKSNGEARRLINQGGVRLDGSPVEGEEWAADALEGRVLQVGRRNFVRIV